MSITLAVIAKDGADTIGRMLESALPFVDKIIVAVDSSTTDNTAEIAAEYGAKVLLFVWSDDFAAARNFVAENVETDWTIFLDCDEVLLEGGDTLKSLSNLRFFDGGQVQIKANDIGPGLRIYRSHLRFEGRIHEQVMVDPRAVIDLSVVVGHQPPIACVDDASKRERNMRILEKAIAEDEGNGFHWYNLGNEHYMDEKWALAADAYKRAYLSTGAIDGGWRAAAGRNLAVCLENQGSQTEVCVLLSYLLNEYPRYTDLFYMAAEVELRLGNTKRSIAAAEKAIALGDSPPVYPSWGETGTTRARDVLARATRKAGPSVWQFPEHQSKKPKRRK